MRALHQPHPIEHAELSRYSQRNDANLALLLRHEDLVPTCDARSLADRC